MLTYGVVLLHDNARQYTAPHTWALIGHFIESLTTLLRALISLRRTTTCLPTWRTGWDHSVSAIMRSWWKVSKCDRAHMWQTWQAYKSYFPIQVSQFRHSRLHNSPRASYKTSTSTRTHERRQTNLTKQRNLDNNAIQGFSCASHCTSLLHTVNIL
jgi:hypothetical protein